MQFIPIFQQNIDLIAGSNDIKAYNAQQSATATASGFIFPSGMPSGTTSANTSSAWNRNFTTIAYQLSTIGRLTTLLIVSAIIVSIIVLFQILAMRIRSRVHEVGVLLAVRVAKGHIIAQFLVETAAILILTFLFSCPASNFAAAQIGVFLRDMIGAVSIDLPAWRLFLQYGIEVLVVIAGVMIAAYPIFQLHPKEILSKMS